MISSRPWDKSRIGWRKLKTNNNCKYVYRFAIYSKFPFIFSIDLSYSLNISSMLCLSRCVVSILCVFLLSSHTSSMSSFQKPRNMIIYPRERHLLTLPKSNIDSFTSTNIRPNRASINYWIPKNNFCFYLQNTSSTTLWTHYIGGASWLPWKHSIAFELTTKLLNSSFTPLKLSYGCNRTNILPQFPSCTMEPFLECPSPLHMTLPQSHLTLAKKT